ncbi:hypothetical protein L0F63_005677 [Massospora cicadina]|nr:hypothetical protein L0F63_005677 [Massospora cicadina]
MVVQFVGLHTHLPPAVLHQELVEDLRCLHLAPKGPHTQLPFQFEPAISQLTPHVADHPTPLLSALARTLALNEPPDPPSPSIMVDQEAFLFHTKNGLKRAAVPFVTQGDLDMWQTSGGLWPTP